MIAQNSEVSIPIPIGNANFVEITNRDGDICILNTSYIIKIYCTKAYYQIHHIALENGWTTLTIRTTDITKLVPNAPVLTNP